jgi:hypothetical protein
MKRTTVFLPDDVHEALRQEAFLSRKSMVEVIRLRLAKETPLKNRKKAKVVDPLLGVAGICSGEVLSSNF